MLDIVLRRKSKLGVALPITATADPELVRLVALRVLRDMRKGQKVRDPVLAETARLHAAALAEHLKAEGIDVDEEEK